MLITAQEVLNAAWQAFVVEGKPMSVNEYGGCLYRGPNGAKCAVGLCIPDKLYTPDMEGRVVDLQGHGIEFYNIEAVKDIQDAHDKYFDNIRERLTEIAEKYNLTIPEEKLQ